VDQGQAVLQSALTQAEQAFKAAADRPSAEWTAPFDMGSLAAETALCLRKLGQFDAAEQHARQAITLRENDRLRGRTFSQLTLAHTLAAAGRTNDAASLGRQICAVAPSLASHRVHTKLDGLYIHLSPHSHRPEVAAFVTAYRSIRDAKRDHAEDSASWPV
jgi:tetratricopeptide (TPR) repeat protein